MGNRVGPLGHNIEREQRKPKIASTEAPQLSLVKGALSPNKEGIRARPKRGGGEREGLL